jgi:hypothetical protein
VDEAMPVERVTLTGSLAHASVWCRKDSPARTASPVPWSPDDVFPWVVEVHGWWPDSYEIEPPIGIIVAVPCPKDPRIPCYESDAAIRWVVARAMLHEGQEATLIDGRRHDPHDHGETGAEALGLILGAWPLARRVDVGTERLRAGMTLAGNAAGASEVSPA